MLHQNIALADRHAPHSWEYADAAARTSASGFAAGDMGKLALQTDDGTYWRLAATTPIWAQVGGSSGSGASGLRNAIINGGFTINQRGYVSAAALAAGVYGHDRWKAGAAGGNYSFTQGNSNTTITIAAGKSLIQVVEDKNVSDAAYVLSWTGTAQARTGINTATPSGSYAASPILITGQTAGTTMSVEFNEGTLAKVQLEAGSVVTPFEHRPVGVELVLCCRYFETSYGSGVAPGSAGSVSAGGYLITMANIAGSAAIDMVYFSVRKRADPTITYYNPISGVTASATHINTAGESVAVVTQLIGQTCFCVVMHTTVIDGHIYGVHYTASAEL